MICEACALWADGRISHEAIDCDEVGCTCQHRKPGAWLETPWQPTGEPSPTPPRNEPSRCSACTRQFKTYKDGMIVWHKRTLRGRRSRCPGSRMAPLGK